jgi:hypothetical protein
MRRRTTNLAEMVETLYATYMWELRDPKAAAAAVAEALDAFFSEVDEDEFAEEPPREPPPAPALDGATRRASAVLH